AAASLAAFVLLEPRCLGGPYALMDPALKAIWLAHDSEMQSLAELMKVGPTAAVAMAAFPAVALIAVAWLAARADLRGDFRFLVAAAAFLLALAIMLDLTKIYPYAMWLGVPLVAVAALNVFSRIKLESVAARFFLGLGLTPTAVTISAMTIASAAGIDGLTGVNSPGRLACLDRDNYAAVARLPPGL